MLSVHRIAFALALVLFAFGVTDATECAIWRSRFTRSENALQSKALLMSIRPAKQTNGRWSKKINGDNSRVIVSGLGACGNMFTASDLVVLLWNGNKNDINGGWGSGSNRVNCNKKVYVQANGRTVYAKVEDFGTMDISAGDPNYPQSLNRGCSGLWMTQGVFDQLGLHGQNFINVKWDFEKSSGNQPHSQGQ